MAKVIVWFTGLPASGKTSLAKAVEGRLHERNNATVLLDGDAMRRGLCSDLGYNYKDRQENIRRVAEVAKLMYEAGLITLVSCISPFRADRAFAKKLVPHSDFIEIYCKCDLEICEQRDPKGLYKRARAGEISRFTGVTSPYEPPENPDLILDTGVYSLDYCTDSVMYLLETRGRL